MPRAEESLRGAGPCWGAWCDRRLEGAHEVRNGNGLAYQATAAMMMQPVESVAEADALDAAKRVRQHDSGIIKSSSAAALLDDGAGSRGGTGWVSAAHSETLAGGPSATLRRIMVRVWGAGMPPRDERLKAKMPSSQGERAEKTIGFGNR